jgi:hypothetical protein
MIEIKNTRDLIQPDSMKLKVLLIGRSRVGKTTWAGSAPNPGIAACETGHGGGTLSLHKQGIDYFEPKSLEDLDALASGHVFRDKETIVLDSLSAMARTIIKDFAIKIPRRGASSPKREQGVPELDDYGVIAEITRRVLDALIGLPKHVVVTALEKTEKDENGSAIACGPDLPGQMFLAAPAMFDVCLYLKTRKAFRVANDPRSQYTQHYLMTKNDGFHVGGNRNNIDGKEILLPEEVFDNITGQGSFPYIYKKITDAYAGAKKGA